MAKKIRMPAAKEPMDSRPPIPTVKVPRREDGGADKRQPEMNYRDKPE
jgi:hypothetical protein